MKTALFYADDHVKIYHGKEEDMAPMPEVACVISDPPYEETGLAWDQWPLGWPGRLLSRVAPSASLWCFGSLRMFLKFREEFSGWQMAQDVVWEKANGSSLHADRFRRVHELAVQFYPRGAQWGGVFKAPVIREVVEERKRGPIRRQGKPAHWGDVSREGVEYEYDGTRLARSVIFAPSVRHGVEHGTPKPLSLLRDLIAYSCPPGGVVLDVFAGSGSTLVAAKQAGARAIGFDSDLAACQEAARRVAETLPGI